MDPPPSEMSSLTNYFSNTLFRFFHYLNKSSELPCEIHTDIGFWTIIPATAVPQLELLRASAPEWIRIEERARPYRDLIVFGGETLERLSAYYYRGHPGSDTSMISIFVYSPSFPYQLPSIV